MDLRDHSNNGDEAKGLWEESSAGSSCPNLPGESLKSKKNWNPLASWKSC